MIMQPEGLLLDVAGSMVLVLVQQLGMLRPQDHCPVYSAPHLFAGRRDIALEVKPSLSCQLAWPESTPLHRTLKQVLGLLPSPQR